MTAGRDGGLQSLELHGIIKLKINDEKMARAILNVINNDKKGIQMQVQTEAVCGFIKSTFFYVRHVIKGVEHLK